MRDRWYCFDKFRVSGVKFFRVNVELQMMVSDIQFIQNTFFVHSLFLSRCDSRLENIDLFFEQLPLLCDCFARKRSK